MKSRTQETLGFLLAGSALAVLVSGFIWADRVNWLVPLNMGIASLMGVGSILLFRRSQRVHGSKPKPITGPSAGEDHLLFELAILLDHNPADLPAFKSALLQDLHAATGQNPHAYRVADLEQFLWKHLDGKSERVAALRPAYYRVRSAICSATGLPKSRVRPSTRLANLFPRRTLPQSWQAFHEHLGIPVPLLHRSRTFGYTIVLLALPFFCVLSVFLDRVDRWLGLHRWISDIVEIAIWPTCLAIVWLLAWAVEKLIGRHRVETTFPSETVRNLVCTLAEGELITRVPWDEARVQARTREIVAASAGLPATDITPDHRLTTDFKLLPPIR